jgi:hypothetical protein
MNQWICFKLGFQTLRVPKRNICLDSRYKVHHDSFSETAQMLHDEVSVLRPVEDSHLEKCLSTIHVSVWLIRSWKDSHGIQSQSVLQGTFS